MFKKFLQRIIEAENQEDGVNEFFTINRHDAGQIDKEERKMKTKTAPLTFAKGAKRITCTSSDVKDGFGKVVWFDENGDPYELEYSKISRRWAFMPCKKGSFEQPK